MGFIRIWNEIEIKEIADHIIMVDDQFGFCPGCNEFGIKLANLKKCPKCEREFKYVSSRDARGGKGFEMAKRTRKKLPHLTFVDYDDYERLTSKDKAADLFKGV